MGKKTVYPVVLTPEKDGGFCVHVPDFDCDTQGNDLADALFMAEDAISMMGLCKQDDNEPLPKPSNINSIKAKGNEMKTLVTVDFDDYRRRHENRGVRKTLYVPSWLNAQAEDAGVNFSATLQEALKAKLGVEAV
ncbi:MAG: type II toxin-antitoxin system HicB family antitoxin [Clostridiales bacterium]|nr:type II toxin-antitoxin system HicB family antitoxin [Clostridiales bacterium]